MLLAKPQPFDAIAQQIGNSLLGSFTCPKGESFSSYRCTMRSNSVEADIGPHDSFTQTMTVTDNGDSLTFAFGMPLKPEAKKYDDWTMTFNLAVFDGLGNFIGNQMFSIRFKVVQA